MHPVERLNPLRVEVDEACPPGDEVAASGPGTADLDVGAGESLRDGLGRLVFWYVLRFQDGHGHLRDPPLDERPHVVAVQHAPLPEESAGGQAE